MRIIRAQKGLCLNWNRCQKTPKALGGLVHSKTSHSTAYELPWGGGPRWLPRSPRVCACAQCPGRCAREQVLIRHCLSTSTWSSLRVPSLPSAYLPPSVNSHSNTHLAKGYFIQALHHGSIFFALNLNHGISCTYTKRASLCGGSAWKEKIERWHQCCETGLGSPSSQEIAWFHFTLFILCKKLLFHFINVYFYYSIRKDAFLLKVRVSGHHKNFNLRRYLRDCRRSLMAETAVELLDYTTNIHSRKEQLTA